MKFPTHGVLSVSTGILFGDLGAFSAVFSYLIGRDAYTHDFIYYAERARAALTAAVPGLPGLHLADFQPIRDELVAWEKKFGKEIDLPESLRGCLADGKDALDTLREITPDAKILVVQVGDGEKP